MVVGSGGVLAELLRDTRVLLLPCGRDDIEDALRSLKLFPLLDGYRGRAGTDMEAIVVAVSTIARFARDDADTLAELDVNPLIATPDGAIAADVLLRIAQVSDVRELTPYGWKTRWKPVVDSHTSVLLRC